MSALLKFLFHFFQFFGLIQIIRTKTLEDRLARV